MPTHLLTRTALTAKGDRLTAALISCASMPVNLPARRSLSSRPCCSATSACKASATHISREILQSSFAVAGAWVGTDCMVYKTRPTGGVLGAKPNPVHFVTLYTYINGEGLYVNGTSGSSKCVNALHCMCADANARECVLALAATDASPKGTSVAAADACSKLFTCAPFNASMSTLAISRYYHQPE